MEHMKNRVIDDVLAHSGKGVHPRIMLTGEDFERIKSSDDPIYAAGRAKILTDAEALLEKEPLKYEIPDGIRLLSVSRGVLARSFTLGMAYRITGDGRYAERLYREFEAVAAFPDWNPFHFLDVGEMCNALGFGYDWIYDWMNGEQRALVRRALMEKGFCAVMDDYLNRERRRSYRWYQDDPGDNWKFVCNGGISVAALAVCDEDDMDRAFLSDIFGYAFDSTYEAVRNMYLPDGSYAEGFMYWTYASDYLAYYTSALKSAAGSDYGLTDYEPIRISAYYVKAMCSGRFYSFNFGDAVETFLCSPVYLWIGKNFGRADISAMRADYLRKNLSSLWIRDMLWYIPTGGVSAESLPLSWGSVGGSNASFRSGWNLNDLYGAIHFGDNNAYHAHADMGTFVVEYGGRRMLCDLGADNYNVRKYRKVYRYRAEGHNTLVINPSEADDQVRMCECYIDRYESGDDGRDAYAVCDMSAAYFGKGVTRGMMMPKDRSALIIQDELTLEKDDTGYWFAHTAADISLSSDKKSAILEKDGVRLWFGVLSDGCFEVMAADYLAPGMYQQGQRDNSEFKKLAIPFSGSCTVSVAAVPLKEGEALPAKVPKFKPIALW